jgi:hypothetical protein
MSADGFSRTKWSSHAFKRVHFAKKLIFDDARLFQKDAKIATIGSYNCKQKRER